MERKDPVNDGATDLAWLGYSVFNGELPMTVNRSVPRWYFEYEAEVYVCQFVEANFQVQMEHKSGVQMVNVIGRTYLGPVVNTTTLTHIEADDGTNDNITAVPESNYIVPQDTQAYRHAAAYHSIGLEFRQWVNGSIIASPTDDPLFLTRATRTNLISPRMRYFPFPDLAARLVSRYENVLLSLLREPRLFSVV
ncbi:hypothetical protein F4778DRAFT_787489 [Xylariomycetidae sp. FL2044]|nr:hypothetical protein F4778DRAFT_787489 [Xylariomycetidae sp. FL2044]